MLSVIFNNKVELLNPNGNWSILTHQLLPYIFGSSKLKDISRPWEGADHRIEMGCYDVEKRITYQMPFVWNHIKILSLTIDDKLESYNDQFRQCFVFKAEIAIYTKEFINVFKHTFTVKNGIYFFMDSVLGTINRLLDKGYTVDDINFEFLDEQCICFNFDAANNQPKPKFALSYDITPEGYYSLIEDMEMTVHDNGVGRRNGDLIWEEVDLTLHTSDKYVISVVDKILCNHRNHFVYHTEGMNTTFSFHTDHNDNGNYCREYSKHLANTETHDKLKKTYTKKLLMEGLQLINRESAIEYLSTKRGAIAKV